MKARPAIILTDYRTGGTFLSLALDSHPLVYCCRAEPLSKTSPWWDHLGAAGPILDIVFRQEMCKVAMCKLVYRQVGPLIWDILEERRARVVHLIRSNDLRGACSFMFHNLVRSGQVSRKRAKRSLHIYRRAAQPAPVALDPSTLLQLMRQRVTRRSKALREANEHGLKVLKVTYEGMTGGERAEASEVRASVAKRLCEFLKVDYQPLVAPTRKVNAYPLWLLISNWQEVEAMVKRTEFAKHLALEEKWVQLEDKTWVVKL